MSLLTQAVGEVARDIPGATEVFRRYGINFCCAGDRPLWQAADDKQLAQEDLEQALLALNHHPRADSSVWTEKNDIELIEHILTRYHDVHRRQLPELIRLSGRVELVHGGHPNCPVTLTAHLEQIQAELEAHMGKEEQVLFPMISRGMHGVAAGPVQVMRHEHNDHGKALEMVRTLTHDLTLPEQACNTWQALYRGLEEFEIDMVEHIHLENNVLFDRIDNRG
ncbi:iron-sulfur cluster repair protein YtfE [Gilvimarinus polysaccharolyticus]|uniref:iron-sulfur cluster repair protein YtfE n=1 Tax=Gilvimarinus polysaccharolyticus TaxID=863921 RepID=UPI000673C0C1|nr:iron-sulfur cluster repair protein YtfE [Gilvimarinus polysaccharolyticus]